MLEPASKHAAQLLFASLPAWLCYRAGTYNPAKLFGVTTLDVARSRAFIGQILEVDPAKVDIPVIGGHAGEGSWCRWPCRELLVIVCGCPRESLRLSGLVAVQGAVVWLL